MCFYCTCPCMDPHVYVGTGYVCACEGQVDIRVFPYSLPPSSLRQSLSVEPELPNTGQYSYPAHSINHSLPLPSTRITGRLPCGVYIGTEDLNSIPQASSQ